MSEYRYIRLISGESVVGNVENEQTVIRIKLPLQVLLDRNNGLVMFPFLPISSSDDRELTIKKDHVLFTCSLTSKVSEYLIKYSQKVYEESESPAKEQKTEQNKLPAKNLPDLLEQLDREINSGKKPS